MKVHCIDCIHSKPTGCAKNQKNGYNNCKKFRAIPIDNLQKEYHKLLISKDNPKRLEYLEEKIKNFNGGTI
jgi:hypothetical protein